MMKAKTRYNDFTGTAAADISYNTNLNEFLQTYNIDTERFFPIGAQFQTGDSGSFYVSIICEEKREDSNGEVVNIEFFNEITHEMFFSLFKRFKVVVANSNHEVEIEKTYEVDQSGAFIDMQ